MELAPIEQYVIDAVRERRKLLGISQEKLAHLLGYSEGFIANIETSKRSSKYNLRHLNELAKVLKCSPKDFFPNVPL
ncbi:helix-turn-helix domain-containing protein [Chitinophaga rhizosphaerae]|uniref:helix-turn-helix domain-containing protein n=1 Tax=Chitinophaga rhizosphaerae TaxID=1864947 RepID=UPI000F81119C|nr:helix-turn-helix transcriptional regulator [Chitinophaga rhizosphaerae]